MPGVVSAFHREVRLPVGVSVDSGDEVRLSLEVQGGYRPYDVYATEPDGFYPGYRGWSVRAAFGLTVQPQRPD